MNHFLLKSGFLACALVTAYSCSNDPSSAKNPQPEACPIANPCYFDSTSNYVVYTSAYLIKAGQVYATTSTTNQDIIVYPELGFATDADGNYFGAINGQGRAILGVDGTPIVNSLNISELEIVNPYIPPPEIPEDTTSNNPQSNPSTQKYKMLAGSAWLLHADNDYLIYSDGRVSDVNCNIVAQMNDPLSQSDIISTTGDILVTNVNTKDLPVIHQSDNLTCQTSNPNDVVKSSSSTKITPTSSSIKPSSSSTTPKSSSSKTPTTTGCPVIKTKGGGGSGWATRYWDCCKPSCSWNENAGGNPSRQCDANGKNQNNNYGAQSICSGGNATTCLSQIPFTVNGCNEYAFAFAAVPASNGGQCGKCFQLTFTGQGKYGDCPNCKKLANSKKKLIIMVTNVGHDVEQGQFDVMIPGGGVGAFNGCNQMGWGNQGEQYGGLLSNCETETGYSAGAYASCLEKKCNSVFGNDSQAKEGCLFLANWMSAASNPMHNYVEVECPSVLKEKY